MNIGGFSGRTSSGKNTNEEMREGYGMRQRIQTMIDKTTEKAERKAADQKRIDTLLKIIQDLMETMGWTAEQSMDAMGIAEDDKVKLASRL